MSERKDGKVSQFLATRTTLRQPRGPHRARGLCALALVLALAACGPTAPVARTPGPLQPVQSAEVRWVMPDAVPVQVTKSVLAGPGPITEVYRQSAKWQISQMWQDAQPALRAQLRTMGVRQGQEAIVTVRPLALNFNGMGPGGEFQINVFMPTPTHEVVALQTQVDVHATANDTPQTMGTRLADAVVVALQQAGMILPPPAAGRPPRTPGQTVMPASTQEDPAP